MSLVFEHPLPLWALALVAGAALVSAYLAYSGPAVPLAPPARWTLRSLRASTSLLLVWCLLQPVTLAWSRTGRDGIVPILIDVSRSMGLADAGSGLTRLARAQALVSENLLPVLGRRFRVELFGFGDALSDAPLGRLEPVASRSDLAGALAALGERFAGRSLAGVVVVSDGAVAWRDRTGTSTIDVPVFTVGVGADAVARDREVSSIAIGDASWPGASVDLTATVVSRGMGPGAVAVTLRERGRPVQVRLVEVTADGAPIPVVFSVSPPTDVATVYTVEVARDPSELTGENNARSLAVEPASRRRRVLIVAGAPGFEHSFLQRALEADPGLEVDALVRKGRDARGADTYYVRAPASRAERLLVGYPASREALFEYHGLVFANVEAEFFTRDQLALTADFVAERGGGFLVLGGRSFEHQSWLRTPLEDVMPVDLADRGGLAVRAAGRPRRDWFRPLLTREGATHPVLRAGATTEDTERRWAALPPLASAALLGGPKPGAAVLAEVAGEGGLVRPLLAVQRYGEGRTMTFTGEAAWRWKMLLPADDDLYERFWRQAVRWLVAGAPERVSVTVPRGAVPGEAITVRVAVRDAAFAPIPDATVRVRVSSAGETAHEVAALPVEGCAGLYEATVTVGDAGVSWVEVTARRGDEPMGTAEAVLLVGGADEEFADPRVNRDVLRRVAEATGGELVEPDRPAAADDLADRLAARVEAREVPVRRELWHSVWTFLAASGLMCLEWSLRRRWGLR